MTAASLRAWSSGPVLPAAFAECRTCITDVQTEARAVLDAGGLPSPARLAPLPRAQLTLPRNLFSTLFQSSYHLLGVPPARRLLYGKLNHLYRVWVTGADNLLDNEDKQVLPLIMPGRSRVMRQVVSIMCADRVLARLLRNAVHDTVLPETAASRISDLSLRVLLPSAAQEGGEEGGARRDVTSRTMLQTVHRRKTALLFSAPLAVARALEPDLDRDRLHSCQHALESLGLGCQVLDDIRDIARDLLENRHNYVLALIRQRRFASSRAVLRTLRSGLTVEDAIHPHLPEVVQPAARTAHDLLTAALAELAEAGLGVTPAAQTQMAATFFTILGVGDTLP